MPCLIFPCRRLPLDALNGVWCTLESGELIEWLWAGLRNRGTAQGPPLRVQSQLYPARLWYTPRRAGRNPQRLKLSTTNATASLQLRLFRLEFSSEIRRNSHSGRGELWPCRTFRARPCQPINSERYRRPSSPDGLYCYCVRLPLCAARFWKSLHSVMGFWCPASRSNLRSRRFRYSNLINRPTKSPQSITKNVSRRFQIWPAGKYLQTFAMYSASGLARFATKFDLRTVYIQI